MAMTKLKNKLQSTSSINSYKGCTCCPYGYHIDLDFIRYCENIANSHLLPRTNHSIRRRPKKRASMEVLLGIQPQAIQLQFRPELMCGIGEVTKASPQISDALQLAVLDFEETLQRTSYPTNTTYEKNLKYNDNSLRKKLIRSPLITTFNLEHNVQMNGNKENIFNICDGKIDDEIDEQTKILKNLQEKISQLEEENKQLTSITNQLKLQIINKNKESKTISNGDLKKQNSDKIVNGVEPIKCRNVGVGHNIIMRDIGTTHYTPPLIDCSTVTDFNEFEIADTNVLKEPRESLKTILSSSTQTNWNKFNNSSIMNTDLRMDQIFSEDDLNRNIDKAIEMYEKRFQHNVHIKKPITLNASIQVEERAPCIVKKDMGVQIKPTSREASIMIKPKTVETFVQIQPHVRDIGVSNHSIIESCPKCKVKKFNVGVSCPEDLKGVMPLSLLGKSKSFDFTASKRKSYKNVSCGPATTMFSNKSTDTIELTNKKDVSINTTKKKLVDAGIDPIEILVRSNSTRMKSPTSKAASRIPRPMTLPISSIPPKPTFIRQDTYTSKPNLNKIYDKEFESDSGSESGTHILPCNAESSSPLFQPITSHVKKEPTKEMKAALKVLNDALIKSGPDALPSSMKTAINVIQQEWFKISSIASADPLDVEDYLDCFEETSGVLLEYIVNMTDVTGNTAMHYAVSHGNFDVVSILLDSKVCNINKTNAAGYTSIMLVSLAQVRSETDRQVVRRLFLMADVNIKAKQYGQTALMLAVSHGRLDTAELLLESGADINIRDADGSTALMCAAEHGHLEIVKLLLVQPDCDVSLTDCDGNTALNIAMEAGNRDIGVLLYAQEHFVRGSSPYSSSKSRRTKSTTPTMKTTPPRTPTSPHLSRSKQNDHSL